MSKSNHYIDNKVFFEAMVEWKKLVIEAEDCGDVKPPVTEYIGKCFLDIAEHLSRRPNFINYPYREEMVGDGIENCLMYAHNFNPEKSKNPFSYFTQIIYYAFLRRIEKEKKQAYVKYKSFEMKCEDDSLRKYFKENYFDKTKEQAIQAEFNLTTTDIDKFTPKKKKKKKKKTKKTNKKTKSTLCDVFDEDDANEDSID
mgnify:CR=1 FL=1